MIAPLPDTEQSAADLICRLADYDDADQPADEPALPTVANLKGELDTIARELRDPPPIDEFEDEAECRRAFELAKAAGSESPHESTPPDAAARGEPNMLGLYKLAEKLGEGGMGAVYKAIHTKLEKIVAIKVLPADKLEDPQSLKRFEREMVAVGKLTHPNIVGAHDAGEADGVHYLVMEHVEGVDLSGLVRIHGRLPVAEACELIRQAAVGLQHSHEHNMVHRDIKPSNLMLTKQGQVKILDMGLALLDQPLASDARELTNTGQLMGTVDYMAPEQGMDTHNVDIRADIYALGATLYRLLSGNVPLNDEKYDTVVKKIMALVTETPPSIAEHRPDLPPELVALVDCMLAKDPGSRVATPAEVVAALEPFAAGANVLGLFGDMQDAGSQISSSELAIPTVSPTDGLASFHEPTMVPQPRPIEHTEFVVAAATAVSHAAPSSLESKPAEPNPAGVPPWLINRKVIAGAAAAALVLLGIIVLFIPGKNSTVRIEIADPQIHVAIRGTDIVLSSNDKEEVRLQPGEHTLKVTRGDLEFESNAFVLKKGEEARVKVEVLAGNIQVVQNGNVLSRHAVPEPGKLAPPNEPAAKPGETESPSHRFGPDSGEIDLLANLVPDDDMVTGNWTQDGDRSWQSGLLANSRIQLPLIPRGAYQLRVRFTRPAGIQPALLILPTGDRQVCLTVGGGEKGVQAGLGLLRNMPFDNNETTKEVPLILGKIHELVVSVEPADQNIRIKVALDGTQQVNWFGPASALSLNDMLVLPKSGAVGLGSNEGVIQYRSATLTMTSGFADPARPFDEAKPDPVIAQRTIKPDGGWQDLFPLIDPAKDAVEGGWKREGDAIVNQGGYFLRLRIPVRVQGAYELRTEFEQTKAVPNFHGWGLPHGNDRLGLRVKEHTSAGSVHYGFHGFAGGVWGSDPQRIVSGKRHVLRVRVEQKDGKTEATATLGDEPYVNAAEPWAAGKNALPVYYFSGGVADEPVVIVRKGHMRFFGVQLRMLDGVAFLLRPGDAAKLKPAKVAAEAIRQPVEPATPAEPAKAESVAAAVPETTTEVAPDYLKLVRDYADCMLKYGRDRYGEVHSPLFASALTREAEPTLLPYPEWQRADEQSNYFNVDADNDNPNEWFFNYFLNLPQWGDDAHKNGVVGEDMQDNEALYSLLFRLSEVTGDQQYAQEATRAIEWWVLNTQSPATGLFPWGEHLCWDFRHDNVSYSSGTYTRLYSRRYHEGKGPFALWEHFARVPAQNRQDYWRDDLRPIERYAIGLWEQHIWDKEHIYWDRHGDYFHPMNELPKRGDGAFPWVIDGCFKWWSVACATSDDPKFKQGIRTVMRLTLDGLLARQKKFGFLPYDMKNVRHYESQNRALAVSIREAAKRVAKDDAELADYLSSGADEIFRASGGEPPAASPLDMDYARSVVGRNIWEKATKNAGYTVTYLGTLRRAWEETGERAFLDAWDVKARTCVKLFFDDKCPLPKAYYKDTLPIGREGQHGQFPTHYSAEWGCAKLMANLLELHLASLTE